MNKKVGFNTFSQLYHTTVVQITASVSGVFVIVLNQLIFIIEQCVSFYGCTARLHLQISKGK